MNTQGEIDDKYEADDMDHAVASHNLRMDTEKAEKRAHQMREFYDFLESHPDFKTFYNLLEASKRY